jgi:hypothetical protein
MGLRCDDMYDDVALLDDLFDDVASLASDEDVFTA